MSSMNIGVLAMQGAFQEHCKALEKLGVQAIEIRHPEQLDTVSGLIIPGGESTTIGKLMNEWGIIDKIKARAAAGMAIYGTCAGMILLAKKIIDSDQPRLGLMDVTVKRNGFGRQRESFEVELNVPDISQEPIKAVFIRAPYIESVGPNVEIMAQIDDKILIAREGKFFVTAFHPELTNDLRIHKYFLSIVAE